MIDSIVPRGWGAFGVSRTDKYRLVSPETGLGYVIGA